MLADVSDHKAVTEDIFLTFNNQTIKALKAHLSRKLEAVSEEDSANTTR